MPLYRAAQLWEYLITRITGTMDGAPICKTCEVAVRLLDWIIEKLIELRNWLKKRSNHGPECLGLAKLSFLPIFALTLRGLGFGSPDGLYLSLDQEADRGQIRLIRCQDKGCDVRPET